VVFELTVLGSAGSHTLPGRMCSGYLVRADGLHLLLDAGNGSTANLQRFVGVADLDAVIVSHRHVDHCIDLVGCFYNLYFDPDVEHRLPLHAAGEVYDTLTGVMSRDSAMAFDEVFDHHQVGHGDRLELGPAQVTFARSVHPPPTVSTRVEVAGRTLVYSGDSAGGEDLVAIARGADLLLCEATWTGDAEDYPPGIHLTARGAAAVARRADVGRLVLTHLTGGTDPERALTEAAEEFDGPIELAEDLRTHPIG
jgi:ribonuclease BN (tRNA processing enzyme)